MSRIGVAVVILGLLTVAVTAAPGAGSQGQLGEAALLGTDAQIDPDTVLLRIDLAASGDANWTVEYRVRLDDENASQAFDSLQADVRENRSAYTARFTDRMTLTVDRAENTTGRRMAVSDVDVTATNRSLPQEYGVLTYTFTWEGFATSDDGTIRAGDAIAGLFLDEETTLIVAWPPEYDLVEAAPGPHQEREDSIVWEGPLDYASGEPRIVIAEGTGGTATPESPTPGGTPPVTDDGSGDPFGAILPAAIVVLALLGLGGGFYLRSRRAGDGSDDGAADGPPEELLSNEERVIALMEEHGGRMKQQEVASALDWTDAKTSQVVGDLRESGKLDGFRLGRENVLSLPDRDDANEE